ncbi:MAG: biotin/lipoyl-containing protein [bacterium]
MLFSSSAWAIRAIAGDGQIQISWISPTKNVDGTPLLDLAGYDIYRGTTREEQKEKINRELISECSYIDSGLKNGQTYYYVVRAVDFSGNPSAPSEYVFATPTILPPPGFAAIGDDNRVKLFWEESANRSIRGYHLYRTGRQGQEYRKITEVPIECTYFEDHEVKNGLTYYYTITSVSEDGLESPQSEEKEATPSANPVEPSDLKAAYVLGKVKLEWPASTDPQLAGYHVYRRNSIEEKQFQKLTEKLLVATSYLDETAEENKRYLYSVVSVNKQGKESKFPLEVHCYTQSLYIASITEDTEGKARKAGDIVTLVMRGEPGCHASFTIEGLTENQAMKETSPGVYHREFIIPKGANLSNAPVWGCLADTRDNRSMKKAAGTISIKNDPPPPVQAVTGKINAYGQPEISWTPPPPESFSAVEVIRSPSAIDPDFPPPSADILVKKELSTYTDEKADAGALYYYVVRTVDEAGNRSKISEAVPIDLSQHASSPAIYSVIDDTLGVPVKTGRIIKVTVEGDRGCEASFSIEGVVQWSPLEELRPGIYQGEYEVKATDEAKEAVLVARLVDQAKREKLGKGEKPLRINVQADDREPPAIARVEHNGTRVAGISGKLVAGDLLCVTLSGEPGGIAFFSLGPEGKKVSMEESRFTQGEYQGTYAIQPGDDAEEITVWGHLSDPAGNITSKSSENRLTIDTRAIITVKPEKGDDSLHADEKSQKEITIEVKDVNEKPLSNHHIALTLSTTDEYTDVVGGGDFGQKIDNGKLAIDFEDVTDSFGRIKAKYTAGNAAKTALIIAKDLDTGHAGAGYITTYIESSLDLWLVQPMQQSRALAEAEDGDAVSMILTADPENITADGRSRSRITVRLLDKYGKPAARKYRVSFSQVFPDKPEGRLSPQTIETHAGSGYVYYQAGKNYGPVTIQAVATRVENPESAPPVAPVEVSIYQMSDAPARLIMETDPEKKNTLETDIGDSVNIKLTVTDINKNPNQDAVIQLWLQDERGNISRNGRLSASALETDKNGGASCTYWAGQTPGLVRIMARYTSEIPRKEKELLRARGSLFVPLWKQEEDSILDSHRWMDMVRDVQGTIKEWFKAEGDEVHKGEPLALIEIERHGEIVLRAPGDGRLIDIKVLRGEDILVGQTVGFMELEEK